MFHDRAEVPFCAAHPLKAFAVPCATCHAHSRPPTDTCPLVTSTGALQRCAPFKSIRSRLRCPGAAGMKHDTRCAEEVDCHVSYALGTVAALPKTDVLLARSRCCTE